YDDWSWRASYDGDDVHAEVFIGHSLYSTYDETRQGDHPVTARFVAHDADDLDDSYTQTWTWDGDDNTSWTIDRDDPEYPTQTVELTRTDVGYDVVQCYQFVDGCKTLHYSGGSVVGDQLHFDRLEIEGYTGEIVSVTERTFDEHDLLLTETEWGWG